MAREASNFGEQIEKEMKEMLRMNKLYLLIAWAITCFLFYSVAAHAEEADQYTKLTFSKPVEIPGQALPAGTYVFKLQNRDDLNTVQILDAAGTRVYATLQTIPAERMESADSTTVILAEQPDGTVALVKWFYPGSTIGHEFVYSHQEKQQLAQSRQATISAKETAESGD